MHLVKLVMSSAGYVFPVRPMAPRASGSPGTVTHNSMTITSDEKRVRLVFVGSVFVSNSSRARLMENASKVDIVGSSKTTLSSVAT